MDKVLVTGATGQMGSVVIKTLLKKLTPNQINVISRNREKVIEFQLKGFNAFEGDYNDVIALEKAMLGTDTVLLISSGDQGDRMQEHKNVIDTAKRSGVANIAYTSRAMNDRSTLANKLMLEHFETEDYIITSGLNYTLFRNALYMDAIPQLIGGNMALEKGIFQPAGEGKVAFALRSEMSEAIANVLMNENCTNKKYHFTGDRSYSFYDVATALSELSGRAVKYTAIDDNTYKEMMAQRKLPDILIQKILAFITDIRQNQESNIYEDLETILGRKPTSLKDGLKIVFKL